MKQHLPDQDLISRLHADDLVAFDGLYLKYHQAIYKNIIKLTRDQEAAKDILQDVFFKLWENRHSISLQQSLSGWLFVVSYNQSISYLRKILRESTVQNKILSQSALQDIYDQPPLVEDQYRLMYMAIENLSPQKRKVLELCKIEGLSYEEAAKKLNISKHTVKEYLTLSLASIRKYVHNNELNEPTFLILLFTFLLSF